MMGAPFNGIRARTRGWPGPAFLLLGVLVAGLVQPAGRTAAAEVSGAELARSIVSLRAHIAPDGRTTESLGTTRFGNGVIIDSAGLVVTIGYLIMESYAIEVTLADGTEVAGTFVGYDHETGFGLLRAAIPDGFAPMRLGDSDTLEAGADSLVLTSGGPLPALPVQIASRRAFAGYWEYLLDDAIFTVPPAPRFGGAALIGADGRLAGIGSLIVNDAEGPNIESPGNMFVPINLLKPLMADLIEAGRRSTDGAPWLGITTLEVSGHVVIRNVRDGGPAAAAGVRAGDVVVGVDGEQVGDTIDFLRKVRALGGPGTEVPLTLARRDGSTATVEHLQVTASSRYEWMRASGGL